MSFSSPRFIGFLIVLLLILALPFGHRAKKIILAVASCLFYAAWNYRYLALLLFVSLVDYACAVRIHAERDERKRKAWLLVSLVSNLGLLAYFKYTNFFLDNLSLLLGSKIPHADILLPAGISFYTFKTMSYTIDVYRRELEPCKTWMDYVTFVTFFPELIAGPIVRASVFLPQMSRRIGPSLERVSLGASVFLVGLTKKMFLADRLATIADPIFAAPEAYRGPTLWMGVLAYTLQIYLDFSGYSDMAIGTAKMIGYDLPQNFRMPYLSANITEFWRRWHITLSSWLRDYLYIPLGGNRKGRLRTYVNLMATMTLGGLWHGASWNFVLWGVLHGAALALHKRLNDWTGGRFRLPPAAGALFTFAFVVLTWVPFRAPSWHATQAMYGKMFSWSQEGSLWEPSYLWPCLLIVVLAHAIGAWCEWAAREPARAEASTLLARIGARLEVDAISGWHLRLGLYPAAGAFIVVTWVLCVLYLSTGNVKPFIYFQF